MSLEEGPLTCQLSSYVRSHNGILPKIHHLFINLYTWLTTWKWDEDGTLLKAKDGQITVTGTEDDPYTMFWIYVLYVSKVGVTYRIQSIESGQYIGIEDDHLVLKEEQDLTDRFKVLLARQGYIAFQSDGGRCIRADANGTIYTDIGCDVGDTHTWFRKINKNN